MTTILSKQSNINSRLPLFDFDKNINIALDRVEIRKLMAEIISGCEIIDLQDEKNIINKKLKYAKEMHKLGLLDNDEATSIYKMLLEDFLNIKIWDFFVNRFTPERAGAVRINKFYELLDWR